MTRFALGLLGFVALFLIWISGAAYVRATRPDLPRAIVERLYPMPHQVASAATELPVREVMHHAWLSSYRVLLGFLLAAFVALPTGFAIGRLLPIANIFEPANDFLRYLPVAGFTSLTILLLGTGAASAVLVVFLGTVFHLVVATADAARRVPSAYLDLARTMSFGPTRRLWLIVIPATAPAVFDNLRVAVGWAWSYVTLAEVMGTEGGLGHAIEVSRRYIRTDQVLFWIFIIGTLGIISDQIMRFLSRRWFPWVI